MRIAALLLTIVFAGCAAQAAAPGPDVDLNALVRAHPLYAALQQYDRQIAALRATLHAPEFLHKQAAFAHAQQAVNSQLETTAARARALAAMPPPDTSALLSQQNVSAPSERTVRGDVQRTYDAQAAALRSLAQHDMVRYRTSLLAQQNAAFASYVRAVQARVQQAYTSRQQQLYEKESTLALDLAKADAGTRLTLRAKLQTLNLSAERLRRLQAQLAAVQRREDAIVARQRARDRATLAAFLPPLQARARADIARMRADVQSRTAATLAQRRRVLDAQTAQQMRLSFGAPAAAAPGQTDMRGRLNMLLHAQPAEPNVFTNARGDLAAEFTGVRNVDDAATRSTWKEIAQLEDARARLYNTIVAQIRADALRAQRAHPGANLTQAVRADLAALSR